MLLYQIWLFLTRKFLESGSAYNVALTAREVEKLNNDSEMGYAISVMGKLALGKGAVFAGAYTGDGVGVYSGFCSQDRAWNPGINNSCDINAAGELESQTGFNLGVTQDLTIHLMQLFATARFP